MTRRAAADAAEFTPAPAAGPSVKPVQNAAFRGAKAGITAAFARLKSPGIARLVFGYKILMKYSANRQQRPWMLRSALSNQEKSVDK